MAIMAHCIAIVTFSQKVSRKTYNQMLVLLVGHVYYSPLHKMTSSFTIWRAESLVQP